MNLEFKSFLPENFDKESRVWIYQASRLLTIPEALESESLINEFCDQWNSHGAKVSAYGNLFVGQFLVLMTDERSAGVSGCSTDSSVRFVKELGQSLGIDFFDRSTLAFVVKDKVQLLPLGQLSYAFENKFIDQDTPYFNNTVLTKEQMENNWIIPIKDSWLAKRLGIQKVA